MTVIKFRVSDEHFQGYTVELDLDYYDSFDEICKQVKETLLVHLDLHNFTRLKEKAKKINFHFQDIEFGDLLLMEERSLVWICNH